MLDRAAVVISLKPEFAQAIAAGTKTVELRRKFPVVQVGTWLVLYATLPIGAVIGLVPISGIEKRSIAQIWDIHQQSAGISKSSFDRYFDGCAEGHVIGLGPFSPTETISVRQMAQLVPSFRPPQSYRFIGLDPLRRLQTLALAGHQSSINHHLHAALERTDASYTVSGKLRGELDPTMRRDPQLQTNSN